MQLRIYQKKAIDEIRGAFKDAHKRVILCAPTGAGKTVIFCSMVAAASNRGKKVLIVTDRKELLTQSGGSLTRFNILSEELTPKTKKVPSGAVVVAMVETLARRLKKENYLEWFKGLDLIIFDEAHKQNFDKLFKHMSLSTFVIGATATPHRENNQTQLKEYYTKIVNPVDIPYLISSGYLAKPLSFGCPLNFEKIKKKGGDFDAKHLTKFYEENRVYEGVIKNYKRICHGLKALAFAPSIEASKRLLYQFQQAGYNAKHLDSKMSKEERETTIKWYKETKGAILCNVGILTTGFDAPSTQCVILYRATKSLPLFLQMCGRGSRTQVNKKSFYILDFGGNIKRHDYWEKEGRQWSLSNPPKKGGGVAPVKECPKCEALIATMIMQCNFCGHKFKRSEKEALEVELVRLKEAYVNDKGAAYRDSKTMNLRELAKMAKAKVLHPHWIIYNRIKYKTEAQYFCNLLGYKKGWLWTQIKRGSFKNLI